MCFSIDGSQKIRVCARANSSVTLQCARSPGVYNIICHKHKPESALEFRGNGRYAMLQFRLLSQTQGLTRTRTFHCVRAAPWLMELVILRGDTCAARSVWPRPRSLAQVPRILRRVAGVIALVKLDPLPRVEALVSTCLHRQDSIS